MKMRIVLSLTLIIALLLAVTPVNAATFEEGVGKDEIPYGDFDSDKGASPYRYTGFDMMTEAEADAAGVPKGYEGYVLKLTGGSGGMGIALDFRNVRVQDVERITFRVYCPDGTKSNGVRLTDTEADHWIMLADPGATEQWVDVVLEDVSKLDDGNGYCKYTTLCFRYEGLTSAVAYIDAITVKLRDPDTTPPVIIYNGATEINTTEGREFVIDLKAHDDYSDVDITPEYIWSDGALDADRKLIKGKHTCTVKATDEAGNSSEIKLTVNVEERDDIAPVISWTPTDVYAMAGALPLLDIIATDNKDSIDPQEVWSDGALDTRGRLAAGEHTLTITATDLTGNETTHTVKFHVSKDRPSVGTLVEE